MGLLLYLKRLNLNYMTKKAKIILGVAILVIALVCISFIFNRATGAQDTLKGSGYAVSQNMVMRSISTDGVEADLSYNEESISPKAVAYDIDDEAGETANSDRMIIKTGSLSMVVKDVTESVANITKYAMDNGGFVVYSNIYKSGIIPAGEVTIRIPADIFDTGVGEIKLMGEIKSESVNGQDVTEEYTDLDARLQNLQASEKQFLQIMNRATKIEDVLAVQRELTSVRGQIESIQGRMKYLSQSVDLSTLTVYLSTDPNELPTLDPENKWKPWAEVKNAARSLVELGKGLVNFIIWLVVYLPLWLVIFGLVWFGRKWWKKRKINM